MINFFKNKDKDTEAIDRAKIMELKNILEDSFSLLIHTFMTDTDLQIIKLEEYIKKEQYIEIKKIAHSMKGASANMGAKYLAFLAGDIETQCRNEQHESVPEVIQLIKNHQVDLKPLLQKFLD